MKTSNFLAPAFFILFLVCSFKAKEEIPSYEKQKQRILLKRQKFKQLYDSAASQQTKDEIINQASVFLEKKILDGLIPSWYGTEWDFNGYTAVPGQGKIACGYFVSTVLKHAGFNLNRYKLAQKHALDEVKILSRGEKIQQFWNTNRDDFLKTIKISLKNDIYVIGLDSHIGFLVKQGEELWFIHSNYRDPVAVVKERASESEALNDSRVFILTSITGNKSLMKAWIEESIIKT
jgi:hypothetical protein